MITGPEEYEKAQADLRDLNERLARLQQTNAAGSKGFTKAGVRKMIARLHEELAVYERSEEIHTPAVKGAQPPFTMPLIVISTFCLIWRHCLAAKWIWFPTWRFEIPISEKRWMRNV